ncbi:hypothetical protein D0Y65_002093 [Glycine soja]|nr:hypothetical protein D0Y65_002093 [Glycine soja]
MLSSLLLTTRVSQLLDIPSTPLQVKDHLECLLEKSILALCNDSLFGSLFFIFAAYICYLTVQCVGEIAESYMDNKSPSNKASEELARELLIAISDSLPDKTLDSDFVPESKDADSFARPNGDWDDKFRSELISISYVESPDVKI